MKHDPLDDFERSTFAHNGKTKDLFKRGQGPGVVVISEIPGITPQVAGFARAVSDAGFRVAMPDIIGEPGRPASYGYMATSGLRACISREFSVLAAHKASPITEWLRALCRDLHAECGGPGVGAVGMCLTGGFALAMMVEPALLAPVLSQPSTPFPILPHQRRSCGISEQDMKVVARRLEEENLTVLGLRFIQDPVCPGERFQALRERLGGRFESIEIDAKHANPANRPAPPHSVLTADLIDGPGEPTLAARDRVIEFFGEKLNV